MAQLLNFVVGGGLLALVQAIASFLALQSARKSGANSVTVATDTKVLADVQTAKQIDNTVSAMPDSDVAKQLQEFTRPGE